MKYQNSKYALLISVLTAFLAGQIFAQDNSVQFVKGDEVTLRDLGVSNPGVLPGNPFYFIKEWGRGVKDNLTFDALQKTKLQLQTVNLKAAELKTLIEILPPNSKTLTKTIDDYQKNLDSLNDRLNSIKDFSADGVDDLLNQLTDTIIKHTKLFSEIKQGLGDKNKNKLSELQEQMMEVIARIPEKIETPSEFKCRLEKIIQSQSENAFKEISIAEVLDRLDAKASKETQLELLKIKENLLFKFQARLQSENFSQALSSVLSQLPSDSIRKIKILDELKEGVADAAIKNKLNLARQEILDRAVESKEIRKGEVETMLKEADGLLKVFDETLTSVETLKSSIINSLFTKANFNLDQAKSALDLANYGQAFGQASASAASSRAGLNYISKFSGGVSSCTEDDVKTLENYHDSLVAKLKEANLDKSFFPELFGFLEKAEKDIAKLSDLIKKNTKADTLIPVLNEARLLLSQVDNGLVDITKK